jgi:hypothetical protein
MITMITIWSGGMQHRAPWEHRVPLLPNADTVEGQLHGQQGVSEQTEGTCSMTIGLYLTNDVFAAPLLCSAILALGFDDKFIRIWEYYFIYCAAGFKSRTLGNYQVRAVETTLVHGLLTAYTYRSSSITSTWICVCRLCFPALATTSWATTTLTQASRQPIKIAHEFVYSSTYIVACAIVFLKGFVCGWFSSSTACKPLFVRLILQLFQSRGSLDVCEFNVILLLLPQSHKDNNSLY